MDISDWVLAGVGDLSAKLAQIEGNDDVNGLAGFIGACEVVAARCRVQLNDRVDQATIDAAKDVAKTALGWT